MLSALCGLSKVRGAEGLWCQKGVVQREAGAARMCCGTSREPVLLYMILATSLRQAANSTVTVSDISVACCKAMSRHLCLTVQEFTKESGAGC